jgi:hypothetical protein
MQHTWVLLFLVHELKSYICACMSSWSFELWDNAYKWRMAASYGRTDIRLIPIRVHIVSWGTMLNLEYMYERTNMNITP